MAYMTNIIGQTERWNANARPTTKTYDDKEGVTFTEYVVEVAEKTSKKYVVRGAKSMTEARRIVDEEGAYGGYEDGIMVAEIDGSFQGIDEYKCTPVEVNKYSACAFKGRCFDDNTSDKKEWNKRYIYCTSYLDGHEGGVCIQCQAALEKGWTLRPKEDE